MAGSTAGGSGIGRAFRCEGRCSSIAGAPQDGVEGRGDSTPGGRTQAPSRDNGITAQQPEPDLPVGLGGSPREVAGVCGSLWHHKCCWQTFWVPGPRDLVQPTACRLQRRGASGQSTHREGTQPHPWADRPPQLEPRATSPHATRPRPSPAHQRAGTSPSPSGHRQEARANL